MQRRVRKGRDRPEAACPPGSRAAAGETGGSNAVQKVLTNRETGLVTTHDRAMYSVYA